MAGARWTQSDLDNLNARQEKARVNTLKEEVKQKRNIQDKPKIVKSKNKFSFTEHKNLFLNGILSAPGYSKELSPESTKVKAFIKPMSVNDCWKGQRFKTDEYKYYEFVLVNSLPDIKLPPPPYKIHFKFGFSSVASD